MAASIAVQILAETASESPWGLSATLEVIRCESAEHVDDVWVSTSAGGRIFVQAKQEVHLGRAPGSDLGATIDDFFAQFSQQRLDPERDRLVLALDGGPRWIRDLERVLERARAGNDPKRLAVNTKEREVLGVIRNHVERAAGSRITPQELLDFLRLLRIDSARREDLAARSKTILATAVVRHPERAQAAWDRLYARAARLAAVGQMGAARDGLQAEILGARIDLRPVLSYRNDIDRLLAASQRGLAELQEHSMIQRTSGETVHVACALVMKVRTLATAGSLIVTGAAGSGKSGILHGVARSLEAEASDVVVLPVVAYAGAQSAHDLRDKVRLDHNIVEVLAGWPGTSPAYFIVDGLDASRGGGTATAFRDVIRQIGEEAPRWRVIASVRVYDLREGLDLGGLFPNAPNSPVPDELREPGIADVRHVLVPSLSDPDLNGLARQIPELPTLLAPGPLRDLLRNLFNIRLVVALADAGVPIHELTPLRTQLQLLDRYWRARVRPDADGAAHEEALTVVCEEMVERQRLSIPRNAVRLGALAPILDRAVSAGVLTQQDRPEGRFVGFAHHILFDYAVMHLLLGGDERDLATRLGEQRRLALVVRPSIRMLFESLWHDDPTRETYWRWVLRICEKAGTPEVARLIGPGVAADHAVRVSDLEPLLRSLADADPARHLAANNALRHALGALYVREPDRTRLVGPSAGSWAATIERASLSWFDDLLYTAKTFVAIAVQRPEQMTAEQRVSTGAAARRLLQVALDREPRDASLIGFGLQAVARTITTNVEASIEVLRRPLAPERLARLGHQEIYWLADEIELIGRDAPALAQDIYVAAFGRVETSDEATPFGDSLIIPMTSNRRQDWEHVHYVLAEKFPKFLEAHPVEAAETAVGVTELYVDLERRTDYERAPTRQFDILGQLASVRADGSRSWAGKGNVYAHERAVQILHALDTYIDRTARTKNGVAQLRPVLERIIGRTSLAAVWSLILRAAAHNRRTLGRELRALAWAVPLLEETDTYEAARDLVVAIFPSLSVRERQRVERAVLGLVTGDDEERRRFRERRRDMILERLRPKDLVTTAAKRQRPRRSRPATEAAGARDTGWVPHYDIELHDLRQAGADPETPAHIRVRDLVQDARGLTAPGAPAATPDERVGVLRRLDDAIRRAGPETHPAVVEWAADALADVASDIAGQDELDCGTELGHLVRAIALRSTEHELPKSGAKGASDDEETLAFGRGPRAHGASALMGLARSESCRDEELRSRIRRLADDPVPAVRAAVAQWVNAVVHDPEFLWELAERFARKETHRAIVERFLTAFENAAPLDPARASSLVEDVLDRELASEDVDERAVGILTVLYLRHGEQHSRARLERIADDPAAVQHAAHVVVQVLRYWLVVGLTVQSNEDRGAQRARAQNLFRRLSASLARQFAEAIAEVNRDSKADVERGRGIAALLDDAAHQIRFAAEIDRDAGGPLTEGGRRTFYSEMRDVVAILGECGLPSVVHTLLELLEQLLDVDPRGIWRLFADVTRAGLTRAYQRESLGMTQVETIVRRYLRDHRDVLEGEPAAQEALVDILDAFVGVGWPTARRLAYQLDELFR